MAQLHDKQPTPPHVFAHMPAPHKTIADRNTPGAGRPPGQRPQTVPSEFIYTPYQSKK